MPRRAAPEPPAAAVQVEPSSGNVFADLGFERTDLVLAKAQLSRKIAEGLAARKLTQATAAKLLGIDRPRVSLLVRGKTGQFSLEKLFELLGRIEAVHAPDAGPGRVFVTA